MDEAKKIWLDDIRIPPDNNFIHCITPQEVINNIKTGKVIYMSLDHDLGIDDNHTGYTLLKWIEDNIEYLYHLYGGNLFEIKLHTANPVGRLNMLMAIESIKRMWNLQKEEENI